MKANLPRLICAALILLFFYTAIAKLSALHRFERELSNQALPLWSVPALLWLIPMTELAVVILLLVPRFRLPGLYASALLMLVFTAYIALVLLGVFDRVPCSCGGVLKNMGFKAHFVFNLFFLLLSFTGIRLLKSEAKSLPD